jgi:MoxR-like ATPase
MERERGGKIMKSVNHKQLGKLIREAYKKKKALFIWGACGIGKSDVVRDSAKQMAKEKGLIYNEDMTKINEKTVFSVIDIRLSQMDLSDIRGLPKYDEKTETTKWYAPNFLPKNGQGLLFLDEINLAVPTVQATAYQLILNRRIGDYVLPDGWLVVSAGNRLEDRANVFETPAPLNNRFLHIELAQPDVDDWIDWAVANGIDTRISTYLKFEPVLYRFDKNIKDKAFPTPRTWFFASEMINDKDTTKDLDMIEILVASCVGEATAMKFTAWLKLTEKIDIKEILKNPMEAKLPKELDMLYATISGILEHYKRDRKLLKPIIQLATRLTPEYAVLLLKLIKTHTPRFTQEVYNMPEWKENAKRLQPYFRKEEGEGEE